MKKTLGLLIIAFVSMCLLSCGGSSKSDNESGADSTFEALQAQLSEVSSIANTTEGAVTLSALSFVEDSQSQVHPMAECNLSTQRTQCSGNTDVINWNSCTVNGWLLTGTWLETYTDAIGNGDSVACGAVNQGYNLPQQALPFDKCVTRTTMSEVYSNAQGISIVTDTLGGVAYDGTQIVGAGVKVCNNAGNRAVTGNVRKQLKGSKGTTLFDHYVSYFLTLTGARKTNNRIATGTITTFHQLAKYKSIHTFNSVTWGSSACCYPTSGTITTAYSSLFVPGFIKNQTLLDFSPSATTCGAANFTDENGGLTAVTLSECK